MSRRNSTLNDRIKVVRAEIVKLSFQHASSPRAKTRLQKQLAGLKQLLLQDIP